MIPCPWLSGALITRLLMDRNEITMEADLLFRDAGIPNLAVQFLDSTRLTGSELKYMSLRETPVTGDKSHFTTDCFRKRAYSILGSSPMHSAWTLKASRATLRSCRFVSFDIGHTSLLSSRETTANVHWSRGVACTHLEFDKRKLSCKKNGGCSMFLLISRQSANQRISEISRFGHRTGLFGTSDESSGDAVTYLLFQMYSGVDDAILTSVI